MWRQWFRAGRHIFHYKQRIEEMEKKTYGAPRLVDWVAQIDAGGACVKIHFTGGALTAYGVTPAEYTTENPFIQRVIENSAYYKKGRIRLLRKSAADGHGDTSGLRPQRGEEGKASGNKLREAEKLEDAKSLQEEALKETDGLKDADSHGLLEVEASCLQDAQAYLQEHFNIASYKVRSYDGAQRAGMEHGVRFKGPKFDISETEEAAGNSASASPRE